MDKIPEYILAKKIQSILEGREIYLNPSISSTEYGNSVYFTVLDDDFREILKVRISDHNALNYDRIFNEKHFTRNADPNAIADIIELAAKPERFNKIEEGFEYFSKENNTRILEGDVVPGEEKVWIKREEEVSEKKLNNMKQNSIYTDIKAEYLRESKNGKKVYYAKYKKLIEVYLKPKYKFERK